MGIETIDRTERGMKKIIKHDQVQMSTLVTKHIGKFNSHTFSMSCSKDASGKFTSGLFWAHIDTSSGCKVPIQV